MQKTNNSTCLKQKLAQISLACKDMKLQLQETKFYYQKLIIQMTKGFRTLLKSVSDQFNDSKYFIQHKNLFKHQIQRKGKHADQNKENEQERSNTNSQSVFNQKKNFSEKHLKQKQTVYQKNNSNQKNIQHLKVIQKKKNLSNSAKSHKHIQSLDIKEIRKKMQHQLIQLKNIQNKVGILDKSTQRMKKYLQQQRSNINSFKTKSHQSFNQSLKNSKGKQDVILTQFNLEENQKILENIQINSLNPTFRQNQFKVQSKSLNFTLQKLLCPQGHTYYTGSINQHKNTPQGEGKYHKCCNKAPLILKISPEIQFYQGEFENGKFNGEGTITYCGGVKFIGQFYKGKRHGNGCLYLNGKCEIGIWKNELLTGLC